MHNMTIPIIKFEIEGMKHVIHSCLTKHALAMDQQINDAVDIFCENGNITKVIQDSTNKAIKIAIEAEISNFFQYGNGRKVIKEAVNNQLDGIYKD